MRVFGRIRCRRETSSPVWLTVGLILSTYVVAPLSCSSADMDQDSCVTPVFSYVAGKDSVRVGVWQQSLCNQYYQKGFLIVQERGISGWNVLWGQGETEHCQTELYLEDLDGSGDREILTLFVDESNIWGFVHRVVLKSDSMNWQHLAIPIVKSDDAELTQGRSYMQNADGSLTLLGTLYDSDKHPMIRYSPELDSLIVDIEAK